MIIPILGVPAAIVGSATAPLTAYARIHSRILALLGLISYSLYLLHAPIGLKVLEQEMSRLNIRIGAWFDSRNHHSGRRDYRRDSATKKKTLELRIAKFAILNKS